MTCKREAGVRRAYMLPVVVANRELSVASFLVGFVHYTDITTAKNRALFGVVSYSKLHQIQREFLTHTQTEDEAFQIFIRGPMLLGGCPSYGGKSSNYLTKLSFCKQYCVRISIAKPVKLFDIESMLWGSEKKLDIIYFLIEELVDWCDVVDDFAIDWGGLKYSGLSQWAGFFLPDARFQIDFADLLQLANDIILEKDDFVFTYIG